MPMRYLKFFVSGDRTVERITDWIAATGIAAGGATWLSPKFYEWVVGVSHGAALLMPVLGVVWLGVQIWSKLFKGQ